MTALLLVSAFRRFAFAIGVAEIYQFLLIVAAGVWRGREFAGKQLPKEKLLELSAFDFRWIRLTKYACFVISLFLP